MAHKVTSESTLDLPTPEPLEESEQKKRIQVYSSEDDQEDDVDTHQEETASNTPTSEPPEHTRIRPHVPIPEQELSAWGFNLTTSKGKAPKSATAVPREDLVRLPYDSCRDTDTQQDEDVEGPLATNGEMCIPDLSGAVVTIEETDSGQIIHVVGKKLGVYADAEKDKSKIDKSNLGRNLGGLKINLVEPCGRTPPKIEMKIEDLVITIEYYPDACSMERDNNSNRGSTKVVINAGNITELRVRQITSNRSYIFVHAKKPGTYADAKNDFNNIGLENEEAFSEGSTNGRQGKIGNVTFIVRNRSRGKNTDGPPTIEIQHEHCKIKIRYI